MAYHTMLIFYLNLKDYKDEDALIKAVDNAIVEGYRKFSFNFNDGNNHGITKPNLSYMIYSYYKIGIIFRSFIADNEDEWSALYEIR